MKKRKLIRHIWKLSHLSDLEKDAEKHGILRDFLSFGLEKLFSLSVPPAAQVVFDLIKEALLHAGNFFKGEHWDIERVNPSLIFEDQGTPYDDNPSTEAQSPWDGTVESYKQFRLKPSKRDPEVILEELFQNLFMGMVEVSRLYRSRMMPTTLEDLYEKIQELALYQAIGERRILPTLRTNASDDSEQVIRDLQAKIRRLQHDVTLWRKRAASSGTRQTHKVRRF